MRVPTSYVLELVVRVCACLLVLAVFYLLFFPFLCYFLYEVIIKAAPFNNILVGLLLSAIISGVGWYIFFQNDFLDELILHRFFEWNPLDY